MSKIKALIAILLICTMLLVISGCTSPTTTASPTPTPKPTGNYTLLTAGKLAVATEAHYPPFEDMNTSNNPPTFEGFDIDLMNEIGKELGLEVVYTDHDFATIITAVQAKKFDAAISAFTITGERQTRVDFSDPYYDSTGQVIVVKTGNTAINNSTDLIGKKVGVQLGTVGEGAVKDLFNGSNLENIRSYATMNEAVLALKKGEVDAVVGDQPVLDPYVKDYPGDYQYTGEPMTETEYFGMVINKENPGLTAAINQALAKIKADGRYQVMYDKWFKED